MGGQAYLMVTGKNGDDLSAEIVACSQMRRHKPKQVISRQAGDCAEILLAFSLGMLPQNSTHQTDAIGHGKAVQYLLFVHLFHRVSSFYMGLEAVFFYFTPFAFSWQGVKAAD